MARDYMKRINALRENYMSHRVEMDILDAYYVTQGFKRNRRTALADSESYRYEESL